MFLLTKNRHRHFSHSVLALIVLFLCSTTVAALPIAEYQQNLNRAITALDTLSETDEDESAADYQDRLIETIAEIRTALPESQSVQLGADVCTVDNRWLHKALDELERTPDTIGKLTEIREALHAIEERVAERQYPGEVGENKDEAKRRLENILARPEYVTKAKGNALSRLIQDLMRWIANLFPKRAPMEPTSARRISTIAQVIVVVVALAILAYVLRILLARFRRSRKLKPSEKKQPRIVLGERLEPEQSASDLLSEAEALARSGDLRAAIRKAYIALLVELGDRKVISLAQHKTNRDYLNSLRTAPNLHLMMRALTESFERHWYGFAQATPDDWQDFRAGYIATLQSGN